MLREKKKCIEEAIIYGNSIIDRYNREPLITDFLEEWALFLNKEEYDKYPDVQHFVNYRMKDKTKIFFSKKHEYNSYEDFKNTLKKRK